MITFNKAKTKNLDKLLEYLFKKQNKYSILEESENMDLDQISVTSKELHENLPFTDYDLNKYLQILLNKNQKDGRQFIKIDQNLDKVWLMDLGIEYYYLGGFKRERKEQLVKRNYEIASIIFGIIASLGVILSIYLNVIDTKRLDKRIDKIELEQKKQLDQIKK
jgi:hypothetical protein